MKKSKKKLPASFPEFADLRPEVLEGAMSSFINRDCAGGEFTCIHIKIAARRLGNRTSNPRATIDGGGTYFLKYQVEERCKYEWLFGFESKTAECHMRELDGRDGYSEHQLHEVRIMCLALFHTLILDAKNS